MTANPNRRDFLKSTGIGLLAINVNGITELLTPAEAYARALPFTVLKNEEIRTLEALGDTLLPGAAADGIAHFVDHHLAVQPEDCLLMIRYLGVEPPYTDFYQSGLTALNQLSEDRYNTSFFALDEALRTELIGEISQGNPARWQGPPSSLFYFVVRADAVDVVYGTMEGFAKLAIPYMAHILPETKW